jgi:hypothetical protein
MHQPVRDEVGGHAIRGLDRHHLPEVEPARID